MTEIREKPEVQHIRGKVRQYNQLRRIPLGKRIRADAFEPSVEAFSSYIHSYYFYLMFQFT